MELKMNSNIENTNAALMVSYLNDSSVMYEGKDGNSSGKKNASVQSLLFIVCSSYLLGAAGR